MAHTKDINKDEISTLSESTGKLSVEQVKIILQNSFVNKKCLDVDDSEYCFKTLFEDKQSLDEKEMNWVLIYLMLLCTEDILFNKILNNKRILGLFSRSVGASDSIDVIKVMLRSFEIFMSDQDKYKDSMFLFTSFYMNDTVFFKKFVENLQPLPGNESNVKVTLKAIVAVSEYFLVLLDYFPHEMSELLAEFFWKRSSSDLPNLEIILLLNTDDDEIKDLILNGMLPNRVRTLFFLKERTLKEHPIMHQKAEKVLERFKSLNSVLLERFENGNQIIKNLESFNLLEFASIRSFVDWPDDTFIKKYRQHLLFDDYQFPVIDVIIEVMEECSKYFLKNKSELSVKPYYAVMVLKSELLIYLLVSLELDMWRESKASTEEDLKSLLGLIPVVIAELDRLVNKELSESFDDSLAETIFGFLHSLTYENVRNYQKEQIKQERIKNWSHQFNEFDKTLESNVKSYVKHQRLLQLQMGTWVYATNPFLQENTVPSVYFIILSHNQSNLLVREFSLKTQKRPVVSQNKIIVSEIDGQNYEIQPNQTINIPLKSIAIFEKNDLTSKYNPTVEKNSKLVNLVNEKYLSQIFLMDKNRKILLDMYLDNQESEFTWFDGLQMISPLDIKLNLTQETKTHIESLVFIRKNLQMLNLRNVELPKNGPPAASSEDDENYYDIDTLKTLTTNLYYD